jgi:hypothetical protein
MINNFNIYLMKLSTSQSLILKRRKLKHSERVSLFSKVFNIDSSKIQKKEEISLHELE